MSGISKIIDERIDQLRQQRNELDTLRAELEAREAALVKRESAPPKTPPATSQTPPKRGRGRPKKGEEKTPSLPSQADLIRMRQALFAELAVLEEQKITLLQNLQAQKNEAERVIAQLEEDKATRQIELSNTLACIKLQKMTELERELEIYREECFVNLRADLERQRALNAQRLAELTKESPSTVNPATKPKPFIIPVEESIPFTTIPTTSEIPPASEKPPPPEAPKRGRGRPRKNTAPANV